MPFAAPHKISYTNAGHYEVMRQAVSPSQVHGMRNSLQPGDFP